MYTAKVAVKYFDIVVNYVKNLQFIVVPINAHTEVQSCISEHQNKIINKLSLYYKNVFLRSDAYYYLL